MMTKNITTKLSFLIFTILVLFVSLIYGPILFSIFPILVLIYMGLMGLKELKLIKLNK